jgi:mercuric reductase
VNHGFVVVDVQQRTSNPRAWAAGDVTVAPQYVYVAAAAGRAAARNALCGATAFDYTACPR